MDQQYFSGKDLALPQTEHVQLRIGDPGNHIMSGNFVRDFPRLLTLAGLDRQTLDALTPVRHSNPSLPDAIIAEMLALNCSDQTDREVHQAKLRLAQAHETAKETTE